MSSSGEISTSRTPIPELPDSPVDSRVQATSPITGMGSEPGNSNSSVTFVPEGTTKGVATKTPVSEQFSLVANQSRVADSTETGTSIATLGERLGPADS